ncbi:hypothetical protein JHK87_006142 [Glycine soja]|nr:hypothetical protein JHK87_006142 [Glycine soja]
MASLKVACVVAVMCMVVVAMSAAPMAQAAITCGQVAGDMSPCFSYLRSGGKPSQACCNGVKSLSSAAKTTADRQGACSCLKNLANNMGQSLNAGNAALSPWQMWRQHPLQDQHLHQLRHHQVLKGNFQSQNSIYDIVVL